MHFGPRHQPRKLSKLIFDEAVQKEHDEEEVEINGSKLSCTSHGNWWLHSILAVLPVTFFLSISTYWPFMLPPVRAAHHCVRFVARGAKELKTVESSCFTAQVFSSTATWRFSDWHRTTQGPTGPV